ncbi:MAG: exostosin family protein, partial [Patescibacteria group bacterium]
MVTLYIGTPLKDVPLLFILDDVAGNTKEARQNLWNFFQGSSRRMDFGFMRIVDDPNQADFFLLPHNYFSLEKIKGIRGTKEYLAPLLRLAEASKKNILVFALADTDEYVDIPHAFVFRYGQYGYRKRDNEIIIPPYTEPALSPRLMEYRRNVWKGIALRNKEEKPTVSFCGWADFPNIYRFLTYIVRVGLAYARIYAFGDTHAIVRLHGIYWRRRAMHVLRGSHLLNTVFILRRSYSAQKGRDGENSISGEAAEKEYIESILHSDFVLAPRGNANASIRFFEALSLWRIPVLIDTDCILPFADKIKYEDFV